MKIYNVHIKFENFAIRDLDNYIAAVYAKTQTEAISKGLDSFRRNIGIHGKLVGYYAKEVENNA